MSILCNICSAEINETEVESHINTPQHMENKSKISPSGKGLNTSVAAMWLKSFNQ
ncbi:protein of unknown function [Nitrosotalea devaniterrae]|uniref:C2H2-type domain-containing protein n=1 Tax=Nitrosotalea devaniterrae TaxID=1078905 RepID=A0A128A1X3_9ARCH|nr:protein of unknown function [Candidatus Nitrosotalea devanaterra]